jgi:hypothetical protein
MLPVKLEESSFGDVLEQLSPYLVKAQQVTAANEYDAPVYLKTLVDGLLLTGKLLAEASYSYSESKNARKRAEAVALLEKFPAYRDLKKIKGTVGEGEAFVSLDDDVKNAQEMESRFDALVTYLQTVRMSLQYSHDDLKKAVYSNKDADKNKTQYLV